MTEKSYFLPRAFEDALSHESAQGVTATEAIIDVDGFKIPGFTLSGETANVEKFRNEAPIFGLRPVDALFRCTIPGMKPREKPNDVDEYGEGRVGDKKYTILSTPPFNPISIFEGGFMLIDRAEVEKDFQATLAKLSGWTGLKITLFAPKIESVRVFPKDKRELHVVVGASPPGETEPLKTKEICGIRVVDLGETALHSGPARGYGVIVQDEEKHTVAQLIDGTIYLFVPISTTDRHLLMENGAGLLKKVLRLAWNAQFEDLKPPQSLPICDAAAYCILLETQIKMVPEVLRETLGHLDQRIKEAEERLRQTLQDKSHVLRAIRYHEAAFADINHDEWTKEWERLSALPGVRNVSSVDNGLHVETDLIVGTYQGKRYPFGRYVIRIGYSGEVSVWCIDPRHPTGRGHPHIGDSGTPCFGNVSIAVHKAATEKRIHAIELILRWLADGYDADLADAKIEEWPTEEKDAKSEEWPFEEKTDD